MIYVLVFICLIIARFTKTKKLYSIVLFLLFFFSAFRFEVGCDWTGYFNQYNVYSSDTFTEVLSKREPLWGLVFFVQRAVGLPYPWINVFSSAVFFLGVHSLARRQPNPLAFLVLLFPVLIINMPMSGIRQGVAIGIVCLAFGAFIDRRLTRFVLLILLAGGVHSSALVFLLLVPLVRGQYSWDRLALAGLMAIPGGLALMSSDNAAVATSRYVNTGVDAAGAAFRVGLLALTALFFFVILRRKWANVFPQDYKLAALGAGAMIITMFIVPVSSVIGDRLAYYLVPIQAMIFARVPYLPLRAHRTFYIIVPYVALLLFLFAWVSRSIIFSLCYVPYRSWLFGPLDSLKYDAFFW
ncbi:EpsG-like putative glucosyltransferase [Ancylobacter aquaticus]|uniref:EpsG-like putative glucosyltransferase n=1 Tax=Ancylobacter aquaticus TaxID=100 RepID=A0A4R1H9G6_ANCAQ|nr:EpsG family protein [Ancylobacter aquaticus]TCK16750.1 EpsG-like putative glucosyltransferase [Ancylobacter aquaticus]